MKNTSQFVSLDQIRRSLPKHASSTVLLGRGITQETLNTAKLLAYGQPLARRVGGQS